MASGARLPLSHLQASFVRKTAGGHVQHPALQNSDGLSFLCPRCYADNGGPEGTHRILCWFEDRVGHDVQPGPGRWKAQGTSLDDVSFVPTRRTICTSVKMLGGCEWHGHIVRGHATL
jgi:hypothetical protein